MSFLDIIGEQIQHRFGNLFLLNGSSITPPLTPPVIYDLTGAEQNFTVPVGVTLISVLGWGAGGGGGFTQAYGAIDGYGMGGAAGGFASADIPVTPGETLTVIVGGGGLCNTEGDVNGGYGGGGNTKSTFSTNWGPTCGGGGGGHCGIYRGSTPLVIWGGGGGGGILAANLQLFNDGCGGGIQSVAGQSAAGGDGGGQADSSPRTFGIAGASSPQTDLNVATAGGAYLGGNGASQFPAQNNGGSGGGGGAGYAGGGGGGVSANVQAGGGGGGSSYFDASCLNTLTLIGTENVPPETGNVFYDGNGTGGAGGTGPGIVSPVLIAPVAGGNGRIVIDWIVP